MKRFIFCKTSYIKPMETKIQLHICFNIKSKPKQMLRKVCKYRT